MAAAANGADACPLFMYSGHDTTIMPILATLGVQLSDWPEYVSNVVSSFFLSLCFGSVQMLFMVHCPSQMHAMAWKIGKWYIMWMQVFELWERKTQEGESKHYVRVLYNKQPLSLAKHPEGVVQCWPLNMSLPLQERRMTAYITARRFGDSRWLLQVNP